MKLFEEYLKRRNLIKFLPIICSPNIIIREDELDLVGEHGNRLNSLMYENNVNNVFWFRNPPRIEFNNSLSWTETEYRLQSLYRIIESQRHNRDALKKLLDRTIREVGAILN